MSKPLLNAGNYSIRTYTPLTPGYLAPVLKPPMRESPLLDEAGCSSDGQHLQLGNSLSYLTLIYFLPNLSVLA